MSWSQKMATSGNYINIVKKGLQMDNKSQEIFHHLGTKRCKIMPKMNQNTFGGRAPPKPTVGALALPRLHSRNQGVPTSKEPTSKGMEGKRMEGGLPPPRA